MEDGSRELGMIIFCFNCPFGKCVKINSPPHLVKSAIFGYNYVVLSYPSSDNRESSAQSNHYA